MAQEPTLAAADAASSLTASVLAEMGRSPNRRLATIMQSLAYHLHAFVRDVGLTEAELETAVDFLNRVGQATDDSHNEAMLLADVLGVSTLVCLTNNGIDAPREMTSALLGPFWRQGSPPTANGDSIVRSPVEGVPLHVSGRVQDRAGEPIPDVRIDVWQSSPCGLYENQDPTQSDMNLRGQFVTDEDGQFSFRSIRPAGYPVPTHGPTGELLAAQNRPPFRPAHVHFLLHKPGFRTLITQVFLDDEEALARDVVFGVVPGLVENLQQTADGFELSRTFVLATGEARLPLPPIK